MSGRNIPIALRTHFARAATTSCRILRIAPVKAGLAPFGMTTLDRDVTVNNGQGAIVYRHRRGYVSSAQVASADLSVDNSEAQALIAEYPMDGITLGMIKRGALDGARYVEYLLNYQSPTDGLIVIGSGTLGEIRAEKGLSAFIELRSLSQTLKQNSIIELGSTTCRAAFGDERCKVDISVLWDSGTVDSVGFEADRTFSLALSSGMAPDEGFYVPGMLLWTSGANEGRSFEIDSYEVDSSGAVTMSLRFPTDELIAVNDEFDIRPDCNKSWGGDGTINNCLAYNNRPNFRGEPLRPVADSAVLSVPGGASGGTSGAGSTQGIPDA